MMMHVYKPHKQFQLHTYFTLSYSRSTWKPKSNLNSYTGQRSHTHTDMPARSCLAFLQSLRKCFSAMKPGWETKNERWRESVEGMKETQGLKGEQMKSEWIETSQKKKETGMLFLLLLPALKKARRSHLSFSEYSSALFSHLLMWV